MVVVFVFQAFKEGAKTSFDETSYNMYLNVLKSRAYGSKQVVEAAFKLASILSTKAGAGDLTKVKEGINAILSAAGRVGEPYKLDLYKAAVVAGEGSPEAAIYAQQELDKLGKFDDAVNGLLNEKKYPIDISKNNDKRLTNIFKWAYSKQKNATKEDVDYMLSIARDPNIAKDIKKYYYTAALLVSEGNDDLNIYAMDKLVNDGVYEDINKYIQEMGLREKSFFTPSQKASQEQEQQGAVTGAVAGGSERPTVRMDQGMGIGGSKSYVEQRPTIPNTIAPFGSSNTLYDLGKIIDLGVYAYSIFKPASELGMSEDVYGELVNIKLNHIAVLLGAVRSNLDFSGMKEMPKLLGYLSGIADMLDDKFLKDFCQLLEGEEGKDVAQLARDDLKKAANGDYNALVRFSKRLKDTNEYKQSNPMLDAVREVEPNIEETNAKTTYIGRVMANIELFNPNTIADVLSNARQSNGLTLIPINLSIGADIFQKSSKKKTLSPEGTKENKTVSYNANPFVGTTAFLVLPPLGYLGANFVTAELSYSPDSHKFGGLFGVSSYDPYSQISLRNISIPNTELGISYQFLFQFPPGGKTQYGTEFKLQRIEKEIPVDLFLMDIGYRGQFGSGVHPSNVLFVYPRANIWLGEGGQIRNNLSLDTNIGYDITNRIEVIQLGLLLRLFIQLSANVQVLSKISELSNLSPDMLRYNVTLSGNLEQFKLLFKHLFSPESKKKPQE